MIQYRLYIVGLLLLLIACTRRADHSQHTGHEALKTIESIRPIALSANQVVISSQKTIKPSRNHIESRVIASGYIAFDERRNNKVALRVSGRIEKLFVKYNYQRVARGQAIVSLYSPELSTYQEEYLFLVKSKEDTLAKKAKEKLRLLGISENQIQQLEKAGEVTNTITITSPLDGFIRFSDESVLSESMKLPASLAMNSMSSSAASNAGALSVTSGGDIKEGMYLNKGQTLFMVNDCRQVWAVLSANNFSQVGFEKGTPVVIYPEIQQQPIHARIDLVEPLYKDGQRFTQARVYLENSVGMLTVNSLVRGEFLLLHDQALRVPVSSVYDLGTRKIVWVKTGVTQGGTGLFEAIVVTTGVSSNETIEIINGLKGDEDVALDGGYMLDSESILNEKP